MYHIDTGECTPDSHIIYVLSLSLPLYCSKLKHQFYFHSARDLSCTNLNIFYVGLRDKVLP